MLWTMLLKKNNILGLGIMKKKSNILKGFLATASLCGTLLASSNVGATSILTTGGNVSLNTGAGLVGGLFTNGATIQLVANLPGLTPIIAADKANAQIGGITTLINALTFGGVEVSQNVTIGALNATIGLNPNFGPLKFTGDNATAIITAIGNQTFSAIDFAGKNSTLQINDGVNLSSNIINTGIENNGIITFKGNSTISGNIGSDNPINIINIGNGEVKLYVSGAANFTGKVKNIKLTDTGSILTFYDGNLTTFIGDINNTTGTNSKGILNLAYDAGSVNVITGDIGNNGSLDTINILKGEATLNSQIVNATNINLVSAGTILNLKDDINVNGNISSNVQGGGGTVNAVGGTITGTINNLDLLQCSGGNGKILNLNGDAVINSIVFVDNAAASGTIKAGGKLTLNNLTFNNSNAAGGVLEINAESSINAAILKGINGTIQINANLTINHPSAGDVNVIRIADKKTYTIDAKGGNVNLLNNGAKIIFEGEDSELDLINTSNTDKQFTLYANLNPSNAKDIYGIVRVSSSTNGLTIANNGGDFTIGQDVTHRLKNFIVDNVGNPENSGNITIDNIVFTKLFSMNSKGKVTLTKNLNTGANGQIVFGADGELVANGITGSVTTSKNNQGILTITSGSVGAIGDDKNSLKGVNIGANAVTFSKNVFAPVLLTSEKSELTLSNNVIVTGSVKTANDKKGILTLGTNSSVTNGIGALNAALAQVKVGAGASSLGGDIYSEALTLTDNTSELILKDGINFGGNITTTADDGSGKLIFEKDGSVGSIGADGAALNEIVFNGINQVQGAAYATNFTVGNANVIVTLTDLAVGSLNYNTKGNVTAKGGWEGVVDFKNQDGTFNLGKNSTLTGSAISTGGTNGIFIFDGNGEVTENLGIKGAALKEIVLSGKNVIQGGINATTITISNAAVDAMITDAIVGNLNYDEAGKVTANDIEGIIDFKNQAGTFNLGNDAIITGSVKGTGGVAGILNFIGNGSVTETIGTDALNSPATINVQGDDATTVALSKDTFVGGVNFENGGKLQLNGNLTTPKIDFGAKGGTLEFKGNGDKYTLNSDIANGENGTLNVLTTLVTLNPTVGTIKTINIGEAGTPKVLSIETKNANLSLLSSPNSSINFLDEDSTLAISNPVAQTVNFANSLSGFAGGGGRLFLDGSTAKLTVSGNNAATLGTAGNELAELNVLGNVTVTDNLDVHNVNQLNIKAGGNFTDQSLTSGQIVNINIGEATGAATYGLDATGRDFNLNTAKMVFAHEDSALNLKNSSNANDSTITLTAALEPSNKNDKFGKLQLTAGAKDLIIDNGGNAAFLSVLLTIN